MFLTTLSGNCQLYVGNQEAVWSRLMSFTFNFLIKGAINEKPE